MRLQIGRQPQRDRETGVVDALLECHTRIRWFMGVAERLAEVPEGTRGEDIAEAAAGVSLYFGEALPRHEADEEESLRPRAVGRDAEIDAMLDEMTRQHETLREPVAVLIALSRGVAAAPDTLVGETAACLAETVGTLQPLWRQHLELEESSLFPALGRILSDVEMAEIRTEMRGRR